MKKLILVLCFVSIFGCRDRIVHSRSYGEWYPASQSCSKSGYCCAVGLDFNGKYEFSCGMKISGCPGVQHGKERSVFEFVHYQKDSTILSAGMEVRTESEMGSCE